jgi:hypothetical protein
MSNRQEEEFYRQKYLKYKAKYLEAKNEVEGGKPKGFVRNEDGDLVFKTKGCGSISGRANCSFSNDCTWDAGQAKTTNKEARAPECLDKACDKYLLVSTCPDKAKHPKLAAVRKSDNQCKWTGDGTKNWLGIEKGKCISAPKEAAAPAAETSSETPTSP